MYNTEVKSGNTKIIDEGTIFSFIPNPTDRAVYEKNQNQVNDISQPSPIEIDLFFKQNFLFTIKFNFILKDEENNNLGWKKETLADEDKIEITIRNINMSKGPIGSSTALYLGQTDENTNFFIAFNVSERRFGVLLEYTIYHQGRIQK